MHKSWPFLLLLPIAAAGQDVTTTSGVEDAVTPVAIQPGNPDGAYRMSDFEHVNVYNGRVSASLPLLEIGGRGEARHTVKVGITRPTFTVEVNKVNLQAPPPSGEGGGRQVTFSSGANIDWWHPYSDSLPYGAGLVVAKFTGSDLTYCNGAFYYNSTFMHVVFIAPDGSETPLYSTYSVPGTSTGIGQRYHYCFPTGASTDRGRIFGATDGSGIVFRALIPQGDNFSPSGSEPNIINGTLYFPNGVRYTIDSSRVQKITDRNGNEIAFTFETVGTNHMRVIKIQDSLQRATNIAYDQPVPFGAVSNSCDILTQSGYAGVDRKVYVCHANLKDRLRTPFPSTQNLFPELVGANSSLDRYALKVVSAVLFSNADTSKTVEANASYQFLYNQFGEVARIAVPTGGAIEYDYQSGLPVLTDYVFPSGQVLRNLGGITMFIPTGQPEPKEPWKPFIYRRVAQRRTYLNGGSSVSGSLVESQTDYSRLETSAAATSPNGVGTDIAVTNNQYIAVTRSSPSISGTTPTTTHHYFYSFPFGIGGVNPVPGGGPATSLKNNRSLSSGSDPFEGKEYLTKIGPDLQSIERVYGAANEIGQLCQENITWSLRGGGSKTSAKVYFYDRTLNLTPVTADRQFNNQSDVFEFDFGNAPPFNPVTSGTTTYNDCPSTITALTANYLRRTHTDFKSSGSFDTYSQLDATSNAYSPFLRSLPTTQRVFDPASGFSAFTTYTYDSPIAENYTVEGNSLTNETGRGNIATITRTVNGDQTSIITAKTYDNLGNILSATDGREKVTTFGYADNFNGPQPSSSTRGFLTSVKYPAAQPVDPQVSKTMKYDYNSGRLYSVTDPNGLTTILEYTDPLDRLTLATRAGQRTKFTYIDTPNAMKVITQADQYVADYRYNSETSFDSFGRPFLETKGTSPTIQVQRTYDGLGRLQRQHRPRYGSTYAGAIDYTYDALGRTVTTTDAWNASVTNQTYDGPDVISIDPKSKQRRSEFDGLGRLVKVVEDPQILNHQTYYTYNVLNNLTSVIQGAQSRTFTYDAIGRLKSATNPESGTTSYNYDPNGNLVKRVDARGWTLCFGLWTGSSCTTTQGSTQYGYDTWNRPLRKQYSAGDTPNVDYCYDGKTGSCTSAAASTEIGRLTYHTNTLSGSTISSMAYVHDLAGRITQSTQTTAGAPSAYTFNYAYFLDSTLARTTTGATGRNLRNCYDDQGRLYWVSASPAVTDVTCANNPTTAPAQYYAKYESYSPGGVEWNVRYGTSPQTFLQTCTDLSQSYTGFRVGASGNGSTSDCSRVTGDLFTETWTYNYGQNNGSVDSVDQYLPGGANVNHLRALYTYDSLNRVGKQEEYLLNASGNIASGWQLAFNYDRYGNRIVDQGQSFPYTDIAAKGLSQYNSANQLIRSTGGVGGQDITYDSAGNMLSHPALGTYTFDAENRQTSAVTSSGSAQYVYDGDGKRVKKVVGGVTTYFAYDAFGQLAYEYSTGSSTQNGTQYLVHDALGSTRMVLDQSGNVMSRRDYFAFGDEIPGSASFNGRGDAALKYNQAFAGTQMYTGKERDAETGLDYFGARYLNSAQGRFTSPDPHGAGASLFDPQSWNGYSYVKNRPLNYIDPDGEVPIPLITAGIGATVGAFASGGFEAWKQYAKDGHVTNWGKVGTAAGGGFISGGLAGLTLGFGAAAGVAATTAEVVLVNASSNVIGGVATRRADEALGYETPVDRGTELTNVGIDAITGGVFAWGGTKVADKLFPIPNVQREIALLRFAHRRSSRPTLTQAAQRQSELQAGANSIVGGVSGGVPTEGSKWLWQWVTSHPKKEVVTSRLCDGDCEVPK